MPTTVAATGPLSFPTGQAAQAAEAASVVLVVRAASVAAAGWAELAAQAASVAAAEWAELAAQAGIAAEISAAARSLTRTVTRPGSAIRAAAIRVLGTRA